MTDALDTTPAASPWATKRASPLLRNAALTIGGAAGRLRGI